jgi:hypothetical protein
MAPSKMTILSFRSFFSAAIRVSLRSKAQLPFQFMTRRGKKWHQCGLGSPPQAIPHFSLTLAAASVDADSFPLVSIG